MGTTDVPPPDRRPRSAGLEEKRIKDGRHVGLDFYDLLIEAFTDPVRIACGPYSDTASWKVVTALRDSATHRVGHFLKAGAGHCL